MNSEPSGTQHPNTGLVFDGSLTDDQVAALDALDKANLIKSLVAQAVEKANLNPTLEVDEQILIMDYRKWKSSAKSAYGVFHWTKKYGGTTGEVPQQALKEAAERITNKLILRLASLGEFAAIIGMLPPEGAETLRTELGAIIYADLKYC